jgi:cell division protein FtsB
MRWPVFLLFLLVVALQYPLWLGRGGWLRVWEIDKALQARRALNQGLEQRNARLDAEVSDLKSGTDAIEDRARYDLGLIRPGEVFVQVPQKPEPSEKPGPTPKGGSENNLGAR